jgi:hypothetical protein
LGYAGERGVPVPGRRVEGTQPSTSKAGPDDAPGGRLLALLHPRRLVLKGSSQMRVVGDSLSP